MKNSYLSTKLNHLFAALSTVLLALGPTVSHAELKCQELIDQRICTDSAPKAYALAEGKSTMIPAPVISGYPSACWNWTRKFQCVEANPELSCDSGANFNTVKDTCSLTAAAVNATVTINSLTYITDATYTYRCGFGPFSTSQQLPGNKECVLLDSKVTDTATAPAATTGAKPSTGVGNPPVLAAMNTSIVTTQTKLDNYVCYSAPVTTCGDKCYEQVVDKASGKIEQKEVACKSPVTNCVSSSNQCTGTMTNVNGNLSATAALGPDGRCIDSKEILMCQSGTIPKCLTQDNCTLASTTPSQVQDNGFALGQEQNYICSNETTTCTQYTTASNCVHIGAWGWDNLQLKSQVGQGLSEMNQGMAKLEGIEKGMKKDDPYIFSGQNIKCHYAVGNFLNTFIMIAAIAVTMVASGGTTSGLLSSALQQYGGVAMAEANMIGASISAGAAFVSDAPNSKAFGSNCCKDYVIQGSDAWYKLGSCSADEVKLSVAKTKGLYHYLGEYCSKKSGFPLKQCVERSKSYCVFDDMLALTVNEQGRTQLDAIASADASTTQTAGPVDFPLFSPEIANPTKYSGTLNNGQWARRTVTNGSQVWTWQYPGYCRTSAKQQAAYELYNDELNAVLDQQGVKPGSMTKEQAVAFLLSAVKFPAFQECADTPGMLPVLTCSKQDDTCDSAKLPESPTGLDVDISGVTTAQGDVNWRIQQLRSYFMPGDYGITATMPSNSNYAAYTASVNEFISATGSCHTDGSCLYNLAITNKQATSGLGARKRTSDTARFPLYTVANSAYLPAVSYMGRDGSFSAAEYAADPNRGLGVPLTVGRQRLIFRPNLGVPSGNMHSHVLVEYANEAKDLQDPRNDYIALALPTNLPANTSSWYPYGDATDNQKHFYISGGCDSNSKWCTYAVDADLNIPRHPWGSPQSPRCWGFTVDQMAALDFDKMDLSRWINSLDLGNTTTGLSAQASKAMSDQVSASAQSFYSAFNSGASINKPDGGQVALVVNTETVPMLSAEPFKAYTVQTAVPANWPKWFDDQPNNNPVTNVQVNWGDGSALQTMPLASTGRAYTLEHDYGDKPVGTYTLKVTLTTAANGSQTLTTKITVVPDAGKAPAASQLDFVSPGSNGKVQAEYTPSQTVTGGSQAPKSLGQLSPGTVEMFNKQGSTITAPK